MANQENRRTKRSEIDTKITLKIINTENGRQLDTIQVDVTDVSTEGIGFYSDAQLMIGEMFKATLQIWTKQKAEVIVKVVRSSVEPEGYSYGCIFVGLPENVATNISIYQMLEKK